MELNAFPPGSVTYERAIPGRERSTRSETAGLTTVTVHDEAIPPVPARFRVTFFISFFHGSVGPTEHEHLHLTIQLPAESPDASYRQVEEQAARQVPAVLRALADTVEQDIARTDRERAEKQG